MAKKTEFEEAIKAKEAEIADIKKELAEAEGDAAKIVAAEKKQRRALAELEILQAAQRAAEYKPAEPTDRQELLEGLKKYVESHTARIDKIKEDISKADKEAAEIEADLQKAAENADTAETLKLSNRRDELKEIRRHLSEMLEKAQNVPVYPDGALSDEWAEICKRLKPEWDNKVMALRTFAKAYKAAADSLLNMSDTLKQVRAEIEVKQNGLFFPSYFAAGGNADELTINKVYMSRLDSIYSDPVHGRLI